MEFVTRISRGCGAGLLGAAALIVLATPVQAGPPLLCPEVVLTDAESTLLGRAIDGKAAAAERVAAFVDAIAGSTSARFRIEAIRWFFHHGESDRGALSAALDRRAAELGDRAMPQDRFDAHLAAIIADWEADRAMASAAALCEIADETGDPARLIIAAEAMDLVAIGRGEDVRRLASLISLTHCRRAAAALAKPTTDEEREVARLLRTHLPYLRGMHSREPGWQAFLATFGSAPQE